MAAKVLRSVPSEGRVDQHAGLHLQRERLRYFDDQPQLRKTRDLGERLSRRHHRAIAHVEFRQHAGFPGEERDVCLRLAALVEARNEPVRNR